MHRSLSRLTFALSLLSAAAAPAQTVDEIVAKNLQAKGGAEKWQSVRSVKTTGTITVQGREMPLTVYARRPNLNRQEITLPDGAKVVQAFGGTTAWMINPMMGMVEPQQVTGPAAEMMRNSADFDGPLIDYKAKGHQIELVGNESLGGKPVFHLRVTIKGGPVQDYFLDQETGIELKTSTTVDVSMGPDGGAKRKQVLETEMSDYKSIEGIMIPHMVRLLADGKPTMQMAIATVELNAAMADSLFSLPKK